MSLFGIGGLIKRARKAAKMSQRELAAAVGVHPSAIGQWEHGQNLPEVGHRIGLSVALNISFTDLLPEVGDRVVLVTDPDLVAIVRLVERADAGRRAALLRAIALLLEPVDPPILPVRPARARRPAKAV